MEQKVPNTDEKIQQNSSHIKQETPKTEQKAQLDSSHVKQETPKKEQIVHQDNSHVNKTQKNDELKSMPLFKAQSSKEYTTEQYVHVKANSNIKIEEKTPKERADETLRLLLRGEKPQQSSSNLTADFSVATAKVIAPRAIEESTRNLEKLLHSTSESSNESSSNSKIESLVSAKADSFEVKLNEAKQMIKYLAPDVKSAIEDYKSPFTRVKLQLNPQKLGDVDLTIVQRGKNLHVNLSSNNAAINALAMNASELRTQLSNSGINNATLNFNNQSDGSNSNASQQQQHNRQNEQKAHKEYNYFDNEDANEEVLSSLEIVVPQYI